MTYGICILNNIPLRIDSSDASEMISQVLFGEHFTVLDTKKQWLYIKLALDGYRGWIDHKQVTEITESYFETLNTTTPIFSKELVNLATQDDGKFLPLTLGSILPNYSNGKFFINDKTYLFDGATHQSVLSKESVVETAFMYLNASYLWGGKSPFGIDCSGFTQMVYKMNGFQLFRDASQQAKQGEVLSFIEESTPGDLAFFDNNEGHITHVGIILANNYIIHSSGKVRVDRLDQSGIYNEETNRHTHKLRLLKTIF